MENNNDLKDVRLSVVIPAFNEASRISETLVSIDNFLSRVDYNYEIIVVDDGSTDDTKAIVQKFMETIPKLTIISNNENNGKGFVVRQGLLAAKGKYRLFMDADNSTTIDQFTTFEPFLDEADVLIGSRALKNSRLIPPQPWYRQVPGKIGNIIFQILLLRGLWDTQCGFKVFNEKVIKIVAPEMRITRWGFDVEMLSLAKHAGFKIKELPVLWENKLFSHVKAITYLQVLIETFKIRWWLSTKKYNLSTK